MVRKIVRATPEMTVRDRPAIDFEPFYQREHASLTAHGCLDPDLWVSRARALPVERQQVLAALLEKVRAEQSRSAISNLRQLLPDALPFVAFGLCGPNHLTPSTIAPVISEPAYRPALEMVTDWIQPGAESMIVWLWGMYRDLAPVPEAVIDKLIAKLDRGASVAARLLAYSHMNQRAYDALVERVEQPHATRGALEGIRGRGAMIHRLVPFLEQLMRDEGPFSHDAAEVLARWGDDKAKRLVRRAERDLDRM